MTGVLGALDPQADLSESECSYNGEWFNNILVDTIKKNKDKGKEPQDNLVKEAPVSIVEEGGKEDV